MKNHRTDRIRGALLLQIAVLLFAAVGESVPVSAAEKGQVREDSRAMEEAARRKDLIHKQIDPLLSEAEALWEKEKYPEAIEKCDFAKSRLKSLNLGSGPNITEKQIMILQLRTDITRQWGKKMLAEAAKRVDAAYKTGSKDTKLTLSELSKAEALILKISREVPEYRKQADALSGKISRIKASLDFESEVKLSTIDPDNSRRKEKIAVSLRQAEVYYKNALYSKARDLLEQILIDDTYNEKAISMLRRIYRKLYSVASVRKENEILDAMSQLDWQWSGQILPRGESGLEDKGATAIDEDDNSKVYEKLRSIIIPEVDFDKVEVQSVIQQLRQLSKDNDPDKKGIDFAHSLTPEAKQQAVTMTLEKIPLETLLDYLCLITGLKYSVKANAVVIGNVDSMLTYTTRMRIATYNNISQGYSSGVVQTSRPTTEITAGGAETSDLFGAALGAGTATKETTHVGATNQQLKDYFEKSGVPFHGDASVTYDPESGILTVKNTRENLDKLKMVLLESEAASQMILIESKFLEILAKDLEELGFEWTLTHNNTNPNWMSGVKDSTTDAIPYGNNALSETLERFYSGDASVVTTTNAADKLINNLNVIPNFGPSGAYNVFLTVHAIDQTSRGETLSAPKVIATASMLATIKLVSEYYFPSSWSEASVTSNNNSFQYKPSVPTLGSATEIGIMLNVTPYLSPNGQTITLQLQPTIRAHDEINDWDLYDYQLVVGDIKSYDAKLRMPITHERSVDTQLKLYDGETIVLGGILDDKLFQVDDRYPFLGDIPLLGRLFSTQMKKEERTNLMIFVSARILKLDGLPKTQKDENGLFYFNR